MLVRPEIVDPAQARAALLDLSADAHAFTPARIIPPGSSPQLRRSIARSQAYARRALADGTLDTYASHWRAYLLWCSLNGGDPVGPDAPALVAAHLSDLADGLIDDEGSLVLDSRNKPVRAPLRSRSIDGHLAAINKAFSLLELPAPGSDPFVKRVAGGIRKTLGRKLVNQRDALTLPLLRLVLDRTRQLAPAAARDLVTVALLAEPAVSSCGQLARLDWSGIEISGDVARMAIPWATRSHHPRRLVTWDAASDAGRLAVEALKVLRSAAGGTGAVLSRNAGAGGKAMSDEGILKAARRALHLSGIPVPARGLTRVTPEAVAAVSGRLARPRLIDVHDRALLLCGFASAARRSNLAAFRWSDFTFDDVGMVVVLRESKTDQDKEGFEALIPYGQNPDTCPVVHWKAWRDEVARMIGGDPRELIPEEPVFVAFDRHGEPVKAADGRLVGISDERVNRMVIRRCAEAGLEGNFGAHSLRAGFVTTAYKAGVSLVDIAEQTGHQSLESVRVYIRRAERWESNPLAKMAV